MIGYKCCQVLYEEISISILTRLPGIKTCGKVPLNPTQIFMNLETTGIQTLL